MTATDDYLRHCVAQAGPSAIVLDLGCGDGRFVEMLLDDGANVIGVDVPSSRPGVEVRSARRPELGMLPRIHFLSDPERLPLDDNSVDVIVSNTVFEHILTLNSTVKELARVLKPGGQVYTVFPLGSSIMEQHTGLPWIHGIESRGLRLAYIHTAKVIGLYRQPATPKDMEHYLYNHVFYRRDNEMRLLFENSFAGVESDTQTYLRIKAEKMRGAGGVRRLIGRLVLSNLAGLARLVHQRHAAAFRLWAPRKMPA